MTERETMFSLAPGSLVVERYRYTNPNGKSGIQWLAHKVEKDGSLGLVEACKTRREALEVVARA